MIWVPRSPITQGGKVTLVVEGLVFTACFIDDPGFDLCSNNVPKPIHRLTQLVGRPAIHGDLSRADCAGYDLEIAGQRSHRAQDI